MITINCTMGIDGLTGEWDLDVVTEDQHVFARRVADRMEQLLSDDTRRVLIDIADDDTGTSIDSIDPEGSDFDESGFIYQEVNWAWDRAYGEV